MFPYKKCFSFLRLAMGNMESLPFLPTDKDWNVFYNFCKRQDLQGIGFTAVEKLHEQGIECPKCLWQSWLDLTLKIEERNKQLDQQCKELTEYLEHDGLHCCILKGQGNLLNYPEELKTRRTPGYIGVWCMAPEEGLPIAMQTGKDRVEYETYHGCNAVIEYVKILNRSAEGKDGKFLYHHIEAPESKVAVYYRPSFCYSPLRNIRMQKWFTRQADTCMRNKNHLGFTTPTPSVNVIYQMCHLFRQIFETGLELRQLADYYYTLKRNSELKIKNEKSKTTSDSIEAMRVLKSFGMDKFAAAVMWVLGEVFEVEGSRSNVDGKHPWMLCEPNEKEGRKLLNEIMLGGNFGQYDELGKDMRNGGAIPHAIWKLKRVMRLVSSYPEETLCEPFFRTWYFFWRMAH